MAKITAYTAATRFNSDDVILKDGSAGTRKMAVANAAIEFAGLVNAMEHRNTYGGRSLGTSITSEQKAAISAGTFDDLFVGDYWTLNSVVYVIADMDYWYNCGDTAFTKHHLVIVPKSILYSAQMNESNTTEGGYVGSAMYTENLETARTTISAAFGDMLLTHREYLTNAVTDGHSSGGAWFDSDVDLMNEIMVYGDPIFTPAGDGSFVPNRYTINKQQLALFALNPKMANIRTNYWLRDVVSSTAFAIVGYYGFAYYDGASASSGVRPVFAIG